MKETPHDLLFNKRLVVDKEAFRHYRENAKHRSMEHTYRIERYKVMVRAFYAKIGEKMVDNPHGVYIRRFGYFTVLMNPRRSFFKLNRVWIGEKVLLNAHTDGRMFHPIFLPIGNNFKFKLFIMDKYFTRKIKMRLKESLENRVKYYNHYGLLNSIYKIKR